MSAPAEDPSKIIYSNILNPASIQGPGIVNCDEQNKGLVPRVIEELFETTRASDGAFNYTITLSMVSCWMTVISCYVAVYVLYTLKLYLKALVADFEILRDSFR